MPIQQSNDRFAQALDWVANQVNAAQQYATTHGALNAQAAAAAQSTSTNPPPPPSATVPAMDWPFATQAEQAGLPAWVPTAAGLLLGYIVVKKVL